MYTRNIWKVFLVLLFMNLFGYVASDQRDIVFLMDITSGATSSELDLVVDFVYKIVSSLQIGMDDMLVSLVTFSSTVSEIFDLNDYTNSSELLDALTSLKPLSPSGADGMASGLNYVISSSFQDEKGARPLADDTLILIAHTPSSAIFVTAQAAVNLAINEIHAFTVGIGPAALLDSELNFVSTDPDSDTHHQVDSFSNLCEIVPILVPKLDSNIVSAEGCVVTTTTSTSTTTTSTTTTTTTPPTTTTVASGPPSFLDIIFVMDKSSGATDAELELMVEFIYRIESILTIGVNDTLVSIVSFSDSFEEHFSLNNYTDQSSLLGATYQLKSLTPVGDALTFQAFSYISDNSFQKGRASAPDIVVLVTYSESKSTAQTTFNANSLRNAGSSIFVVGIGPSLAIDNDELVAVASSPDSYYLHYVENFTALCDLIPTFAPKLDSSKAVSADICLIPVTQLTSSTSSIVTTSSTNSNQDEKEEDFVLLVGAVAGGIIITILILIGAIFLPMSCKKRNLVKKKTAVKHLASGSNSNIQQTDSESQNSAPKSTTNITILNTSHNSDGMEESIGTGSPSSLMMEKELPGMITEQESSSPTKTVTDNGPASSMVSMSDQANTSDRTFDEGYRSNSVDIRSPVSDGSDNLSFSSSEKNMFRHNYNYEKRDSFGNLSYNTGLPPPLNVEETKLVSYSDESWHSNNKKIKSNKVDQNFTAESKGKENEFAITCVESNNVTNVAVADAIHSGTSTSVGGKSSKPPRKKRIILRQDTQSSIYSRRPSTIHIDFGEV